MTPISIPIICLYPFIANILHKSDCCNFPITIVCASFMVVTCYPRINTTKKNALNGKKSPIWQWDGKCQEVKWPPLQLILWTFLALPRGTCVKLSQKQVKSFSYSFNEKTFKLQPHWISEHESWEFLWWKIRRKNFYYHHPEAIPKRGKIIHGRSARLGYCYEVTSIADINS